MYKALLFTAVVASGGCSQEIDDDEWLDEEEELALSESALDVLTPPPDSGGIFLAECHDLTVEARAIKFTPKADVLKVQAHYAPQDFREMITGLARDGLFFAVRKPIYTDGYIFSHRIASGQLLRKSAYMWKYKGTASSGIKKMIIKADPTTELITFKVLGAADLSQATSEHMPVLITSQAGCYGDYSDWTASETGWE